MSTISIRQSLLCAALICAAGPAGYAAQAPAPAAQGPASVPAANTAPASAANATLTLKEVANFVPVTDAILRAPKPEDWLMYRGNYAGWGYSPLDKITKANIKNLQLVWSRAMAPGENEITPIVYNGVMYLANPNDVIQAIDAATGDLLWEYKHPLPPAEMLHNHQGEHKRSLALYGNFVVFVSFDNIVIGLDARTGKRVFANPRGAVHPKTGEIAWKHQTLPRDNWDQECTFEMMVINTPVNPDANAPGMMSVNPDARKGMRKTLTGVPCKTGIAWSFDAATGEFLWARSTVEQNLVAKIDGKGLVSVNEDVVLSDINKTYRVCPTFSGGRDWPMGAYNPKTNVMFMPLSNACIDETARTDREVLPQFVYNTTNVGRFPTGKDKVGRIDAISVETGRTVWSWETRVANYSPLLATGSGLLFNGGLDHYLRALDADTGQVIWQTRLPSQTVGGAITYSINGRQYIAIAAGGGAVAETQFSMTPEADMASGNNAIYVFALPQ